LAIRLNECGSTNLARGVHGSELLSPDLVTTQGFEKGVFPRILTTCRLQGAGKTGTGESMQHGVTHKALEGFGELTDLPAPLESRTSRTDVAATAVSLWPGDEL
jgi:hypothetical protein